MSEVMPPIQNLFIGGLNVFAYPGVNFSLSLIQKGFKTVADNIVESPRVPMEIVNRNPAVKPAEIIGGKISERNMLPGRECHQRFFNAAFIRRCHCHDKESRQVCSELCYSYNVAWNILPHFCD
jgi:hypothetical protein